MGWTDFLFCDETSIKDVEVKGTHVNRLKFLGVLLGVVGTMNQAAMATSGACTPYAAPDGQLLNVSSAGWATKDEPVVSCAVLNPTEKTGNPMVFMVETREGDAFLELKYVDKKYPLRQADDWQKEVTEKQSLGLGLYLRQPARPTDAVLILDFDQSFYKPPSGVTFSNGQTLFNDLESFGVCVYGYPKEGRQWTSVSISTSKSRPACASVVPAIPVMNYFEH